MVYALLMDFGFFIVPQLALLMGGAPTAERVNSDVNETDFAIECTQEYQTLSDGFGIGAMLVSVGLGLKYARDTSNTVTVFNESKYVDVVTMLLLSQISLHHHASTRSDSLLVTPVVALWPPNLLAPHVQVYRVCDLQHCTPGGGVSALVPGDRAAAQRHVPAEGGRGGTDLMHVLWLPHFTQGGLVE